MDETSREEVVGRVREASVSALEAYSTVGELYLRCDQRDDLLIERYGDLLDALWFRLSDEDIRSLAQVERT